MSDIATCDADIYDDHDDGHPDRDFAPVEAKRPKISRTYEPRPESGYLREVYTIEDEPIAAPPHAPTGEQAEVIAGMMHTLTTTSASPIVLMGTSGSGKTSVVAGHVVYQLQVAGKTSVGAAFTHVAARTLTDRTGILCVTVHKLLAMMPDFENSGEHLGGDGNPSLLSLADVIVVDEASMLNAEFLGLLKEAANRHHCKIIFIGDPAQLAPFGERECTFMGMAQ